MGSDKLDLKRLKELAEKATRGEWTDKDGFEPGLRQVMAPDFAVLGHFSPADAAFIAASRAAVPALVARVEELERLLKQAREAWHNDEDHVVWAGSKRVTGVSADECIDGVCKAIAAAIKEGT